MSNLDSKINGEVRNSLLRLPSKPTRLLLGVSGGVDSMVLLDVLSDLRNTMGFELIVAHLDHSLRADSESDKEFVESECLKRSVRCYTKKVYPTESNLEAWGRDERYKFFQELFIEHSCDYIITAHHKDDLVETFIFRLLSGRLNNLGTPIKAYSKERSLVRPLLQVRKEVLLSYSKEKKIEYREDSTNIDETYRRNFIRHSIVPTLEKFEPTWTKQVAEYMNVVGELEQYVCEQAELNIGSNLSEKEKLSDVLLQKVLYLECASLYSEDALKISKDRMDDLLRMIKSPEDYKRECDLGFGIYAVVDRVGAENAGVSFFKRSTDTQVVHRISDTEFHFEFGGGLEGRLELFSSREECLSGDAQSNIIGSTDSGTLVSVHYHALPVETIHDVKCGLLLSSQRVSTSMEADRILSKIFKDEKWNEERRRCAVVLSAADKAFLLGCRFFTLDLANSELDTGFLRLFCRLSVFRS